MPSRCFWLQFSFARCALGNTGRTFTSFHVVELRDDGRVFSPLSAAFFGLLFGVEALGGLLTKTSRLKIAYKTTTTIIQSGEAPF